MNSIMGFVVCAVALTVAVIGVLLWVLLRGAARSGGANQTQANVEIYRDQFADLERDKALGTLDDASYTAAREELSRRLLEDTATAEQADAQAGQRSIVSAVVLAVLVPALALVLYMALGDPRAFDPKAVAAVADKENHPDMSQLADSLAKKLEADPKNPQGWVMLGRTYRAMERFAEAQKAYERSLALENSDDVALERVEVIAQQTDGNFAGEPWAVIRRVLAKDGKHVGALLLAGSASYSEANFRDAVTYWSKARAQLDNEPDEARGVDNAIAKAREKLGEGAPPPWAGGSTKKGAAAPAEASPAAAGGAGVSGRVTLSASAQAKVAVGDTVFIYATPGDGSRMPLAIQKITVAQLPFDFQLDDSSAMNPQAKISGAGSVMVKARVSKTGNAISQSGDWIGTVGPVKVGAKGLKLTIGEQVP